MANRSNSEKRYARGRAKMRCGGELNMASVAEALPNVAQKLPDKKQPRKKSATYISKAISDNIVTKPESLISKKGTTGDGIDIMTNYFKLTSVTNFILYEYRVDFDPEEENTPTKIKILRNHKDTLGGYLFDGSVLFTPIKLAKDEIQLFSIRETDQVKIRIKIRLVGAISSLDAQYLQVFNIIVRRCLQALNLQLVGRHYFDSESRITINEYKLELWPGYITSIRQHEDDILMCTEITHKVMRKETVHDILLQSAKNYPQNYKEEFKKKVIGMIVLTSYSNKTYRVDDVDFSSSPKSVFTRGSTEITYVEYYNKAYGVKISDKNQPLLVSKPKQKDRRRGLTTLIRLVPELCRATGITDEMRSNIKLMQVLANHTRLDPGGRQQRLLKFHECLRNNGQVQQDLKEWNMSLSQHLVSVPARLLPREKIILGRMQSSPIPVSVKNDWSQEVKGKGVGLLKASVLRKWFIISSSSQIESSQKFQVTLQKAAADINFRIERTKIYSVPDEKGISGYIDSIEQLLVSDNPQIILIIVNNRRADRYSAIKKKCCVDKAVPTQFVLLKNTGGNNTLAVASNIAIQMCCKIGGAPWSVEIPLKDLMVVGFDVYHDTKNRSTSIGALVASLDQSLSRYFSAVSRQKTGEELSNQLTINMFKALQKFQSLNDGRLPQRIVIYRDGVGEGQIPFVKTHEVNVLKSKLQQLYGTNPVKMAFIIVTKRINSRLFHGKKNPSPGTIVDDVITLAQRYDFFLVSQSVQHGTVSPTSYNVIEDTLGLDPDKIQRLTYKLTHMYFNWSGTVRVPALVQYAHKLAFLVGHSVHAEPSSSLEDLLYFL